MTFSGKVVEKFWWFSSYQLTSRCFVASWLRDMSSSLVLMLRRCMSLSKDTRFTVVSFMDYKHRKTG